jgi:lysophospholipase L1-like esterase
MEQEKRAKKRIPRWFKNILISLCALFLFFGALEISFRVYAISSQKNSIAIRAPEDTWCQYDPVLGWKHIPGKVVERAYQNIPVAINQSGVRADREYAFEKKRILAVGCSFTFGHGVEGKEAWPQRLEDKLRANGFDWDVINGGICAYGLDQMYLWFLENRKIFKPDTVILGLINDNINRTIKCRWMTGHGKPRYRIMLDQLVLTNVPTPRRVQPGNTYRDWANTLFDLNKSYLADFFIQRLDLKREAGDNPAEKMQIAQKILQAFSKKCKESNEKFLVVLIEPIPGLEGFLIKNKIDFTRCSEVFRGQEGLYLENDGHPTRLGHDLIAEQAYGSLAERQSSRRK